MITLVVAYNCHNLIADENGNIPWKIKEDLRYFRQQTWEKTCIMGRKTWDSLPESYRPLPNRNNIIITRDTTSFCRENFNLFTKENSNCYAVSCVDVALQIGKILQKEIYVVGGGEIYKYFLDKNLSLKIIASEIKNYQEYNQGVFFPNLNSLGYQSKILQEFEDFTVKEYFKN